MKPAEDSRPARPEGLLALALDDATHARAVELLREGPSAARWRRLLFRVTLVSGAVLVLAGIICLFAFNWQDLPKSVKFGLLASSVLLSAFSGWKLGTERLAGKVTLSSACVLVGVWLAVHGQVYQTGADAFELFRAWSLLVLPWVLLARFQPLWGFWILLLNLWLGFWFEQAGEPVVQSVGLSFFALNGAAWLLWEFLAEGRPGLSGRAVPRVLALGALVSLLVPATVHVLENHGREPGTLSLLLLLSLGCCLLYVFRFGRRDLFVLTAVLGCFITLATTFVGRHLLEGSHGDGCGMLFFLALILIAEVGGAAVWLRSVHQEVP